MTSRIRALNEQLFQDVQQNKKVTTRKILTDLTKLRRELRKCINKNICLILKFHQLIPSSRNSTLRIFPETVFGSDSRYSISRGYL